MNESNRTRFRQFRQEMSAQGIQVALMTSPISISYYTGFYSEPYERFLGLLIDNESGNTCLYVPALDQESAQQSGFTGKIIPIFDHEDPFEKLKNNFKKNPVIFGIEKRHLNIERYEQLIESFPESQFQDLQHIISSGRLRKTDEEVQRVKQAVTIIEQVLDAGIRKVTPGMTELELSAEFDYLMKKLGAEGPAFETTVLTGKRSSFPHGHSSSTKLEHGDYLLIDMGVKLNGYCSDITRTFVIGEASVKQREIYQIVLDANLKAIQAAKIGEPIGNIDIAARFCINEQGYGKFFNNRVGHGLGMEVHEEPSIHEENKQLLEPYFLFTIEPGIYIPEIGGVRIEDDVYIDSEGEIQVLTTYPKKLIEL